MKTIMSIQYIYGTNYNQVRISIDYGDSIKHIDVSIEKLEEFLNKQNII